MARLVAIVVLAIVGTCAAQIGLGGIGLGGGLGYGVGLGGIGIGRGIGLGGVGLGGVGLGRGIGLGLGGLHHGGLHHGHGLYAIPNYAYTYGVQDKLTHDNKQVSEVRKGAVTQNQYSSQLIHPY